MDRRHGWQAPVISVDVVATLWGLSGALLAWVWLDTRRAQQLRRRMERLKVAPAGTDTVPPVRDARYLARALGAALRQRWPGLVSRRGSLAAAAGSDETLAEELLGWRVVVVVVGALLGALFGVGLAQSVAAGVATVLLVSIFSLIGYELWLRSRAAARDRAIEQSLLTVMDLLSLSLGAGMGLDRALRLICERVDSPTTEELRLVLAEIDLGVPRRDAFSHLAERLALDDVRSLTTAIIQAEELSMSMVDSMRIQARGLRVKRRLDAETAAQRSPVLMLFPMAMFILPALFIIILSPVVLQLVRVFGR